MILLVVLIATHAQATVIKASSCSQTDVQTAVDKAVAGDVIQIPSGTCTWGTDTAGADSALSITVPITLEGAGQGVTTLIDNNFKSTSVSCSGGTALIYLNSSATTGFRITNFTIQGQSPDPGICNASHISLSGNSQSFRVDHMTFNNIQTEGVGIKGGRMYGLIDHSTFNGNGKTAIWVRHDGWGGDSFGDGSWAAPTNLGSANAIYIEDCTFNDPNSVGHGSFDVYGGGRVVFRHNTATWIGSHGTESTGRVRGMRSFEVYDNTFTAVEPAEFSWFYARAGTGVIFNNTINNSGTNAYTGGVNLINDRDSDSFAPWGVCDGLGQWDSNGTQQWSGTVATGGNNTFTASGTPAWTTNQWRNYAIYDVTANFGSTISANTANTITNNGSAYSQSRTYTAGDTVRIYAVNACIDQIGRGPGVLLSGSTPSPTGWVNESLEPVYGWGNTSPNGAQTSLYVGSSSSHIAANRDYYDYTASFSGTSGVGSGTLAARPSTCTPKVGYWATDTSTLYQCSATNTWTAYYTPYTYPHPLTLSSTPPPIAPTGLAAVVH